MAHLSFIEAYSFGIWLLMAHSSFIKSYSFGVWLLMAHLSFIESSSFGIWVLMAHWSSNIRSDTHASYLCSLKSWRVYLRQVMTSWLLYVRAHSFMSSHDSFMSVRIHVKSWLFYVRAYSFISSHDSFMCVLIHVNSRLLNIRSWLYYVRAHSNHDSFMTPLCMHVTWLIHLCDITGSQEYLQHKYLCMLTRHNSIHM